MRYFSDDMILLMLGVGGVILYIIYVVYQNSVVNRKFKSYEFAIEELNRQIFVLEKHQKKSLGETHDVIEDSKHELRSFSKELLKSEVSSFANELLDSINDLQQNQDYIQQDIYGRIEHLENKFTEYLAVPNKTTLDEKRVMALAGAGYTAEGIARELHANLSEVSFILKLHKPR
jgi:hypothetical protein